MSFMRACVRLVLAGVAPALALAVLLRTDAQGRDCRVTLIPHGTKFSCGNCHVSIGGGGARTAFGEAVRPLVGIGCAGFWSAQMASLDSDGDGISNGDELQDPAGAWRPGATAPGNRALATNPGVPNRKFIRGDSSGDGRIDLADAEATLLYLFRAGAVPRCRSAADSNNDGRVDVSDAVFILFHLFSSGGLSPPPPFPACDIEILTDTLDCASYTCP